MPAITEAKKRVSIIPSLERFRLNKNEHAQESDKRLNHTWFLICHRVQKRIDYRRLYVKIVWWIVSREFSHEPKNRRDHRGR
jgi:hypothetical protein